MLPIAELALHQVPDRPRRPGGGPLRAARQARRQGSDRGHRGRAEEVEGLIEGRSGAGRRVGQGTRRPVGDSRGPQLDPAILPLAEKQDQENQAGRGVEQDERGGQEGQGGHA